MIQLGEMDATDAPAIEPSATPSGRRSRRRWIRRGIGVAALILLARFAYLRIALHPTPRSDYWQAQIDALDPPGPGALKYSVAVAILTTQPWEPPPTNTSTQIYSSDELLCGAWDIKRPDMAQFDAAFQSPAFIQARVDLVRMTRTDWEWTVNYLSDYQNPGWSAARQWSKCLLGHARWALARSDTDAAVEDWQTVLRLARQACRSHLEFDGILRSAIESMTGKEMLLTAGEPHEPIEVRALAALVDELRPSPFEPAAYLKGERLFMHDQLERMFVREGGDWLDVSACAGVLKYFYEMPPGSVPRLWNLASPLFNNLGQARQHLDNSFYYLTTLSNIAICEDVDSRRVAIPAECEVGVLDGDPLSYNTTRVRAIHNIYVGCVRLEAGLTALALAEYRRQHGEYPVALDSLVPEHLHRLPVDYGDRGVLRYRRLPDGAYLLYSIGVDGKDDGGRFNPTLEDYPDRFDRSNPDAVFSAVRRKKAPQFHRAESGGGI